MSVPQVQQYGSPYDPYTSCSPRLQSTAYTSTSANGAGNATTGNPGNGLHQEPTTVYVAGDALPPLASSSSTSSLSTTTASYTRYEVVPSSYATTHAIRTSSSSSKVLTVDLPSPDSGIGADAVTPRQDHHPPTALHQVSPPKVSYSFLGRKVRHLLWFCNNKNKINSQTWISKRKKYFAKNVSAQFLILFNLNAKR